MSKNNKKNVQLFTYDMSKTCPQVSRSGMSSSDWYPTLQLI